MTGGSTSIHFKCWLLHNIVKFLRAEVLTYQIEENIVHIQGKSYFVIRYKFIIYIIHTFGIPLMSEKAVQAIL